MREAESGRGVEDRLLLALLWAAGAFGSQANTRRQTGRALMGDKSPKAKEKAKKQTRAAKEKKHAAHEALMASKRKDSPRAD
jgi:hypothetical protein